MENGKESVKPEIVEAAIVPIEPDVRLGSLAVHNPEEMVSLAAKVATALAEVINAKKLYVVIEKNKYVMCEGWTTMGGLIGVLPIEDYCRRLPDGNGFEAKVNLIRIRDGAVIGGASAECSKDEGTWKNRDSHTLRSMALTRATGKAYRLGFSWLIKLAGFSPTPAEEMLSAKDAEIEEEVTQEVERQKGGAKPSPEAKMAKNASNSVPALFWMAPDQFNGHRAVFLNLKEFGSTLGETEQQGLKVILKKYLKGKGEELWVPTSGPANMTELVDELVACKVNVRQLASRG